MWVIVMILTLCGVVQGVSKAPLVSTKLGEIEGLEFGDGHAQFLGVPYAVVDENNPFGPSTPHPGFNETFKANESKMCPQIKDNIAVGTLDSLVMNIYVPKTANPQNLLPVMVWIHGGGFVDGSADDKGKSSPKEFMKHDVIVIGINYRLGIYGFMNLDIPEVPGNQGLKDQVLAFRWIRDNIEAFGGDPNNVTAFGCSAGGISINLHLLSPYEKLFEKAIIQSGTVYARFRLSEVDYTVPIRIAKVLGFNTTDKLEAVEYLSTVDPLVVINAVNNLQHDGVNVRSEINPKTVPYVEKRFEGVENFVTEKMGNIVSSSKVETTPILLGDNSNEAAVVIHAADDEFYKRFDFGRHLSLGFDLKGPVPEEAVRSVKDFYIKDDNLNTLKDGVLKFMSDFYFSHPTQKTQDFLLNIGASSLYRYIFSYSGGRNLVKMTKHFTAEGATHADDLGYLFYYDIFEKTNPQDQIMVDRMITIWTNFAKYGNPIPNKTDLLPIKWEPTTKSSPKYVDINLDLTLGTTPFPERMEFWNKFYDQYGKYQI
uniref:SFRICE006383.2 n=1 Tax=Spodoptera frugiperda TaxID=7108 RepID=A0A2H1VCP9_SPOFR